MSESSPLVVDIHTHVYPPSYIDLLASRTTVPYIHKPSSGVDPRLIILSSDDDPSKPLDERGRPIDASKHFVGRQTRLHDSPRHAHLRRLPRQPLARLPPLRRSTPNSGAREQ
jgi:hypothetical protein